MKNPYNKNPGLHLTKKKILLVDGGANLSKLMNFILSADYQLTVRTNGIEAFSWLDEGNDPDLIISSLRMPYLDGGLFIHNLRLSGFYRNTPVMLLSGEDNLAEKVISMSLKIDGFMNKPFDPSALKTQISRLIA